MGEQEQLFARYLDELATLREKMYGDVMSEKMEKVLDYEAKKAYLEFVDKLDEKDRQRRHDNEQLREEAEAKKNEVNEASNFGLFLVALAVVTSAVGVFFLFK